MSGATEHKGGGMETPAALIDTLVSARSAGDFAGAAACYESNATIVAQPGQIVSGEHAIAMFVEASAEVELTFTGRSIAIGDGIALHQAAWSFSNPDGSVVTGCTVDILRQQLDGSWRLALDNPWGSSIVEPIARG